ncbi:conserved hypothetical protein [delta proteobacterium NaphS2]|nr:conserved hypothetical protein [delta proteobacterium NaphS2]
MAVEKIFPWGWFHKLRAEISIVGKVLFIRERSSLQPIS